MPKFLTATEEKRLLEDAVSGNIKARNCVIMNIYYLVRNTVKNNLVRNDSEREDAIQFVVTVLCEKFMKFDISRNYRYITYANFWVRQAMQEFRLKRGLIRLPRLYSKNTVKLRDGQLNTWRLKVTSIESPDPNETHYFQDYLHSREAHPEHQMTQSEDIAELNQLLTQLKPRDRDIVVRRSLGESLQQIGDDIGLTKERIRQIEINAIERMKKLSSHSE